MRRHNLAWKSLRITFVLATAAVIYWWLMVTRPVPPQVAMDDAGVLVQVVEAQPQDTTFTLRATGTIEPVREVRLSAQVPGAIVDIAPGLQEGSSFRKGDLLFRIDPTDYRIEVQRLTAEIEQIAADKDQLQREAANYEESRQLASREVELASAEVDRNRRLLATGSGTQSDLDKAESSALTARTALQLVKNQLSLIPSRQSALNARNEMALAQKAAAESRLAKCEIRAPFDGRALDIYADPGEYVIAGAQLADIWDISAVEITVQLLPEEFRWLVPDAPATDVERWLAGLPPNGDQPPPWLPAARVIPAMGTGSPGWQGFVRNLEGRFDRETRTLPVVVEVPLPLDAATSSSARLPLLPGMFCTVELAGRSMADIVRIPRSALQGEGAVWVAVNNTLRPRAVKVVRLDGDDVFVTTDVQPAAGSGHRPPLHAGEQIVISVLSNAVDGMKIRTGSRRLEEETTTTREAVRS